MNNNNNHGGGGGGDGSGLTIDGGGGSGGGGAGAADGGNGACGPEPMDETGDVYSSGREASGAESGSDAAVSAADAGLTLGRQHGGGGGGPVEHQRATREESAAKALQSAARVMLERKGSLQRLARETSALLVIQKRSREWLKQHNKQDLAVAEEGRSGVAGAGAGGGDGGAVPPPFSPHNL